MPARDLFGGERSPEGALSEALDECSNAGVLDILGRAAEELFAARGVGLGKNNIELPLRPYE